VVIAVSGLPGASAALDVPRNTPIVSETRALFGVGMTPGSPPLGAT
jgi:hypothetical protein